MCNSQEILNGNFEKNFSDTCDLNLGNDEFNLLMNDCFAFGIGGELDIQTNLCGYSEPSSGKWFISLATFPSVITDGLSLFLSSPIIRGETYQISYFEKADTIFPAKGIDSLLFGVSMDKSKFGIQVHSSLPIAQNSWSHKIFKFLAPENGKYLTIKNQGFKRGWNLIDDIKITNIKGFVFINPNPTNGNFTISTSDKLIEIHIYDSIGRLIISKMVDGITTINLNLDTSGVYFIRVKTSITIETKKLIVCK